MEQSVARIISRIFNPLALSTYYLIILFNLRFHFSVSIPEKARWMILGLVFVTTYILPGLLVNIFGLFAKKTFKLQGREERLLILVISAIFYLLTYYLLSRIQLSPIYSLFILGSTTLIVILLIITLFWRISVYSTGMGAFFGAFLGLHLTLNIDMLLFLFIALFIGGLTGFSRLQMGKHTPTQIYVGFALGAGVMLLHFLYL